MRDELISDLDAFFGKNYSNFDLISALPSYEPVTIAMLLRSGNRVTDGQNTVNERQQDLLPAAQRRAFGGAERAVCG